MKKSKPSSNNAEASKEAVEKWLDEVGTKRRPTINDVATLAGVSKKTVSRVINKSSQVSEETRAGVKSIIKKLNFEPDMQARGLAFRHSFLVGMIYDNPNPQYVVNFQEGVLEGLRGTDYELAVHHCDRAAPSFIEQIKRFVERQRLFGVILTPSVSEDDRLASWLHEAGRPFIRVASLQLDKPEHMLVSNDRLGGIEAGRHLAQLGHENIAFISGREGFRSSLERQSGLMEALKEFDLTLKQHLIFEGAYTLESGFSAAERMLSLRDLPTAVFVANDQMAVGVLQAIRARGLSVPEDISVVGYDDFNVAQATTPRLTTIHSPTREMGKLAVTKLLHDSNDKTEILSETVPWLVVRDSTSTPKSHRATTIIPSTTQTDQKTKP